MAVYKGNLKKLRKQVEVRTEVIERGIEKLKERIAKGKSGKSPTAKKNLAANKASLKDAKKVLIALNRAHKAFKFGCCQNDLNCDPELL